MISLVFYSLIATAALDFFRLAIAAKQQTPAEPGLPKLQLRYCSQQHCQQFQAMVMPTLQSEYNSTHAVTSQQIPSPSSTAHTMLMMGCMGVGMLVNSINPETTTNPALKMLGGKKMLVFAALFMAYRYFGGILEQPSQGMEVLIGQEVVYKSGGEMPTVEGILQIVGNKLLDQA